ncbi:MAG: hypothetical protein MK212_20710 [Saprospiraceae bacterium]|nr:hypothetical protein [Saprospiraceae bacterium]
MVRKKESKPINLFTLTGVTSSILYLIAFFLFIDHSSPFYSKFSISLSTILYDSLMILISLGYLFLPQFAYIQAQSMSQNTNILDAPQLRNKLQATKGINDPLLRSLYLTNIIILIIFILLVSINFYHSDTLVYSMIYAIVWTIYGSLILSSK